MSASLALVFLALSLLAYLIGPAALIWGWMRWSARPKTWSFSSIFSFAGFLDATASAVLGIALVFAALNGVFERDYALFFRVVSRCLIFSLLGVLLAVCGAFRNSSFRWVALVGALSTSAFWMIATTWP